LRYISPGDQPSCFFPLAQGITPHPPERRFEPLIGWLVVQRLLTNWPATIGRCSSEATTAFNPVLPSLLESATWLSRVQTSTAASGGRPDASDDPTDVRRRTARPSDGGGRLPRPPGAVRNCRPPEAVRLRRPSGAVRLRRPLSMTLISPFYTMCLFL
jgi:hypothetical protein